MTSPKVAEVKENLIFLTYRSLQSRLFPAKSGGGGNALLLMEKQLLFFLACTLCHSSVTPRLWALLVSRRLLGLPAGYWWAAPIVRRWSSGCVRRGWRAVMCTGVLEGNKCWLGYFGAICPSLRWKFLESLLQFRIPPSLPIPKGKNCSWWAAELLCHWEHLSGCFLWISLGGGTYFPPPPPSFFSFSQ